MTTPRAARSPRRLPWARLLRIAAAGQVAGLLAAAAILGDLEAAAIGVATLVGLGLLPFRAGRVGAALLALLFADTGFFTGAAAVTNLVDRASPAAAIGPGALAAIAVPGLVAAIMTLVIGRRPWLPGAVPVQLPALAATLFAGLAVTSLATGVSAVAADNPALQLDIKDVHFLKQRLVATGGTVTVGVANHDLFWHTFTIDELRISLNVPVGSEQRITFSAPPGTYTYYCAIPGHRATMTGTLVVSPR